MRGLGIVRGRPVAASIERRAVTGACIVVELPFPPGVNNLFFNTKHGGRAITEAYAAWRKLAAQELQVQRARCAIGPVEITFTFQEQSKRKDLDGLLKAPLDCLVENGIIDGDCSKTVRKITAAWGAAPLGVIVEIVSAAAVVAAVAA